MAARGERTRKHFVVLATSPHPSSSCGGRDQIGIEMKGDVFCGYAVACDVMSATGMEDR